MHKLFWALVSSLAVFAFAKVADAHSFICEKTVNGQTTLEVSTYPTTLHYQFVVINNHDSLASTYDSVSDSTLADFSFEPAAPHEVPFGGSVTDTFDVPVASYEDCLALSRADGTADEIVMNTFTVVWHGGQTTCSARVTCVAPPPPPPPPPPPEGGATRTPGFYKTHIAALEACLAEGPIDLGFIEISSIEHALGLLWGVPAKFTGSGIPRSELDKARFILARHTLVGICNNRLFGTEPDPSDLLTDAVAALAGTDCSLMHGLAEDVDDFNNSGDDEDFPEDFEPGKATPQQAFSMAVDPTSPSGLVCSG